jgi:HK97 family phage major capsid protein
MESHSIIDLLENTKPKKQFEMDKKTLYKITQLTDDTGNYLWHKNENMPDTLLGIPIIIKDEKCFQIRYAFCDGSDHVERLQFTE